MLFFNSCLIFEAFCDEKINFKKRRGEHFKEKRNCQSQNVSSGAVGIKKEFSASPIETFWLSRPHHGFGWLICRISHGANQSLYCYRGKVDRIQAITVWVSLSRATTQISRFLEESSPTPPKHDQDFRKFCLTWDVAHLVECLISHVWSLAFNPQHHINQQGGIWQSLPLRGEKGRVRNWRSPSAT